MQAAERVSVWARIRSRPAEGPSAEDQLQADITATVLGATHVGLIYVNRADMDVTEFPIQPVDREAARQEMGRLRVCVEWGEQGLLPPRKYGQTVIARPRDTVWPCGYCRWLDTCEQLPAEVKAEIETKTQEVKSAIERDDQSGWERAAGELEQTMMRAGQAAYGEGQQGAGAAAADGQPGQAGGAPSGTVEGEFREV